MDWISWFCCEDRDWLLALFQELIRDRVEAATMEEFVRRVDGEPEPVQAFDRMKSNALRFPSQTIACLIFALLSQGNILGIWDHFNRRMNVRLGGDIHPDVVRSQAKMDAFAAATFVWCNTTRSAQTEAEFISAVKAFFE